MMMILLQKESSLKTLHPKSCLNKGGRKGKRAKGYKKENLLDKPDSKFAKGGVITFQNNEEIDENDQSIEARNIDDDDTYEHIIKSNKPGKNNNQNDYVDQVYSDSNSDPQKLQNNNRMKGKTSKGHQINKVYLTFNIY